jgi:hypothetical protein
MVLLIWLFFSAAAIAAMLDLPSICPFFAGAVCFLLWCDEVDKRLGRWNRRRMNRIRRERLCDRQIARGVTWMAYAYRHASPGFLDYTFGVAYR